MGYILLDSYQSIISSVRSMIEHVNLVLFSALNAHAHIAGNCWGECSPNG